MLVCAIGLGYCGRERWSFVVDVVCVSVDYLRGRGLLLALSAFPSAVIRAWLPVQSALLRRPHRRRALLRPYRGCR